MLKQKTPIIARICAMIVLLAFITLSTTAIVISAASPSVEETKPVTTKTTTVLTTEVTQPTETKEFISTPLTFPELEYKVLDDADKFLSDIESSITKLDAALKTNDYTPEACNSMKQELTRLQKIKNDVEADIAERKNDKINDTTVTSTSTVTNTIATNTVKAPKPKTESASESAPTGTYYYATKTREFFKQRGYSDVVISGIIGNMMIETSGGTLDLKPHIYDAAGQYYGLCQWSLYYRPDVADMSFENQLEYLASDMESEFRTFGSCYYDGFTYESFLNMSDPSEAALAFAKVYERCGSGSYNLRKQAAVKAYNYFTS